MFANLGIPSFDELLNILFLDFGQGMTVSNNYFLSSIYNCRIYSYTCTCMWTWLIIIWDTCFPHRMLTSLDFYYVTLHVSVIYLFYDTCINIL